MDSTTTTASTAPDASVGASVNTGASASASSTPDVFTDTAGSTGNAVTAPQPEATPAPEAATAVQAPADQFDLGWKLDDEGAEQPLVPDDDAQFEAQLQELTQEPGLIQERVPGLIQAIKNERTDNKRLSAELRQERQTRETLQRQIEESFGQYGGIEGAQSYVNKITQLFDAPNSANGANEFLDELHSKAGPVFDRLFQDIVLGSPQSALQLLQAQGLIPETQAAEPSTALTPERLAAIPEHLREVAKSLPPAVQEDLLQQPDDVRDFHLNQHYEFAQMRHAQRQQAETAWNNSLATAKETGEKAAESLYTKYEQATYRELSKWKPYGPEGEQSNQRVYKEMVEGAYAELLADSEYGKAWQESQEMLRQAPLLRLYSEAERARKNEVQADQYASRADFYERQSANLAARMSTRLGQLLRERVQERDSTYRDAHTLRALLSDERYRDKVRAFIDERGQASANGQPKSASQRTEIMGKNATALSGNNTGRKTRMLDENGRLAPEYIAEIAAGVAR